MKPLLRWVSWSGGLHQLMHGDKIIAIVNKFAPFHHCATVTGFGDKVESSSFGDNLGAAKLWCEKLIKQRLKAALVGLENVESRHITDW